jgi:DNA polymerase-3 subunit delta'
LEEPPSDSALILIATDTDSLLPTIRSRCQLVRFAPLTTGDLAELILDLEIAESRDEAETMAALSDGSLTVARQLADPELRQLRATLYDSLADTEFDSLAIAEELLAGLDRLGGDAQNRRSNAVWLIRFCTTFFSASVRFLSEGDANASIPQVEQFSRRLLPATDEDLELLMALFDRSALASEQIGRMTPVPLCLQALFDDLGRMLRSRTRK